MAGVITIYTDGGCDPNPGPGGWASLIIDGKTRREISGAEEKSTNNRMELTAAIEALRTIKEHARITLYTDSQYLKKGIDEWMPRWLAKNWRGTNGPVANQDLWQELLKVSDKHQVTWRWLRGHSGNPENERVDRLCKIARDGLMRRQASR
jgi:ribonuclease HI